MGSVVEVEAYLQISHSHSICGMENFLHSSGKLPWPPRPLERMIGIVMCRVLPVQAGSWHGASTNTNHVTADRPPDHC
jgi:hypothetical protein